MHWLVRYLVLLLAVVYGARSRSAEGLVEGSPHKTQHNSYLVQLHNGTSDNQADQIGAIPGVTIRHRYQGGGFNGLAVTVDSTRRLRDLARTDGVQVVYPNGRHRLQYKQSAPSSTPNAMYEHTGLAQLLREQNLDGRGIRIGIIDTGVDYTHPDLGGCWKTPGCPWQFGEDLVGDEYDYYSENPITKPGPYPTDCIGHGTHVSGIIMAQGKDVRGIAPAATMGMYRVFGCPNADGEFDSSDELVIRAMEAAHRDGVDIISLSIGWDIWGESPTAAAAANLVSQGVIVVSAAGNWGQNGLVDVIAPSTGKGVISVGSVDSWTWKGRSATFTTSNGSNTTVGVATDAGSDYTFVFEKAVPVATTKDPADTNSVCNPLDIDLTGKVLLARGGSCANEEMASNAQDAGAIGVVVINPSRGIGGISNGNAAIPLGYIQMEDGDALIDLLATGEVTVTVPEAEDVEFENWNGGQMSAFSSYGPSPELDLQPVISAPGSNIYSTYPQDKGSYRALSGTSMAAPYVSGVAALLKQARPELSVDQVRKALVSTAKPITDRDTGRMSTPHHSGSGLVNIHDAITSRIVIDPPTLSINDTAFEQPTGSVHREAQRTLRITNTDPTRGVRVSLLHSPANSVTMFNTDGTLVDAVNKGTSLPIWPHNKNAVPDDTLPRVLLSSQNQYIGPGQAANISAIISAPYGLPEQERWFYGGFIEFLLQWDGEGVNSTQAVVPYAGFNGEFGSLSVFAPASTGLPTIINADDKPVDASTVAVSANSTARVAFKMDMPSRIVTVALIDKKGTAVGYPKCSTRPFHMRTVTNDRPFVDVLLDGTVCSEPECIDDPTRVPPGKYHVRIKALRMFGDQAADSDYDMWESDEFTIE
ncbi:hypothetical protein GGF46_000163 [Coemansia sp. RSA 552]|nr:hypothetical protein GGF46_000163 [Coemansia sp. RSA 552]